MTFNPNCFNIVQVVELYFIRTDVIHVRLLSILFVDEFAYHVSVQKEIRQEYRKLASHDNTVGDRIITTIEYQYIRQCQ